MITSTPIHRINQYKIIFNILSWFVCLIPLILIFSNALSDIIVVCASLFFIYVSIKENNWEWIKEKWFRITLLIYFWLIITSFFAYDTELALSRSTTWVRFAIFAAALQYLFLNNKTNKNRILIITFFSILYVCFEMLAEYFTGFSFYSRITPSLNTLPPPSTINYVRIIEEFFGPGTFNGGSERLSGPFKDAPKSGIYLVYFVFPVLIGMTKLIKHKFTNYAGLIFGFSFLILNVYLIYASGHRASMLYFLISLFLLIFYFCYLKKKLAVVLIATFFLLGIFVYNNNTLTGPDSKMGNLVVKTVKEIKNYSDSSYGSLSKTSIKMFKTHPITGVGLKNYRVACEKDEFLSEGHSSSGYGMTPWSGYYDHEQKKYFEATCSAHPHNLYLTWLAETGIFGFLLFITFLISISIKIIKYKKIVFNELIIFSILLSLIPKLIPMMPSLNFFSNWNAICFWLLIGWLLSFLPKESNKKKSIKNLSHF